MGLGCRCLLPFQQRLNSFHFVPKPLLCHDLVEDTNAAVNYLEPHVGKRSGHSDVNLFRTGMLDRIVKHFGERILKNSRNVLTQTDKYPALIFYSAQDPVFMEVSIWKDTMNAQLPFPDLFLCIALKEDIVGRIRFSHERKITFINQFAELPLYVDA